MKKSERYCTLSLKCFRSRLPCRCIILWTFQSLPSLGQEISLIFFTGLLGPKQKDCGIDQPETNMSAYSLACSLNQFTPNKIQTVKKNKTVKADRTGQKSSLWKRQFVCYLMLPKCFDKREGCWSTAATPSPEGIREVREPGGYLTHYKANQCPEIYICIHIYI